MSWSKSTMLILGLAVAVFASALVAVHQAYRSRHAWNELYRLQAQHQQLQVEWGQLLLQHATIVVPSQLEALIVKKQLYLCTPNMKNTVIIR